MSQAAFHHADRAPALRHLLEHYRGNRMQGHTGPNASKVALLLISTDSFGVAFLAKLPAGPCLPRQSMQRRCTGRVCTSFAWQDNNASCISMSSLYVAQLSQAWTVPVCKLIHVCMLLSCESVGHGHASAPGLSAIENWGCSHCLTHNRGVVSTA